MVQFSASASYQGPIPPEMLAQYEHILPGSADRFLTMMEGQAAHRMDLDKQVVENDVRQSRRGPLVTAWITTLALLAAIVCAWRGQGAYAATIVGSLKVILGAGCGLAIVNRRDERNRRWGQMQGKPKQ